MKPFLVRPTRQVHAVQPKNRPLELYESYADAMRRARGLGLSASSVTLMAVLICQGEKA